MISSDMEEVIGVSDRIAVLCEGTIAGFLERSQFSEANAMPVPRRRPVGGLKRRVDRWSRRIGPLLLILVIAAVVATINPRFLSPVNLANTANLVGLYGLFSLGLGSAIITAASTSRSGRSSP